MSNIYVAAGLLAGVARRLSVSQMSTKGLPLAMRVFLGRERILSRPCRRALHCSNTSMAVQAPMADRTAETWQAFLHPDLRSPLPYGLSADRITVNTNKGSFIDSSGGVTAVCLGQPNERVNRAMQAQLAKASQFHPVWVANEPSEQLAALLVKHAGPDYAAVYMVSGGGEAVDAAMKLVRQYFYDRGEGATRTRFIARRQGYHGSTLGALSLTGVSARTVPYAEIMSDRVSHVSPCYAYQYKKADETDEAYVQRLAEELDAEFQRVGPETVCAFVAETVSGSISGCVTPVPGYLAAMKQVCEKHGALLFLDEVMCGMGRTGSVYAWQQEGVAPDVFTLGKALSGGFQPVGAVVAHKRVVDSIRQSSGKMVQTATSQGHSVATTAALEVQKIIEDDHLLQNVNTMGKILEQGLKDVMGKKKYVGNIRGRGLFWGVEFVKDKATRESLDPSFRFGYEVNEQTLRLGMFVYPGAGTVDGKRGDHVFFAPAFIVNEAEVRNMVDILGRAYDEAEKKYDQRTLS